MLFRSEVSDIESKILQDADNLDAIGAMGIIRSLKYGFIHNEAEYDPSVPLYQNEYEESKDDISTIHHINNKLIRLGDYMNTTTAKNLAKKRIALMKDFLCSYLEETNSDFSKEV